MGDGLSLANKPIAIHRHNLTRFPSKSEGELGCCFLLWNRVNNPWDQEREAWVPVVAPSLVKRPWASYFAKLMASYIKRGPSNSASRYPWTISFRPSSIFFSGFSKCRARVKENRRGDRHTGSRTSHIATPTAPSALGRTQLTQGLEAWRKQEVGVEALGTVGTEEDSRWGSSKPGLLGKRESWGVEGRLGTPPRLGQVL